MTPAQKNRQEAIGMLSELYIPQTIPGLPGEWEMRPDRTADEIAGNISKLAQLGRTARWQAAVNRWAAMVAAAEDAKRLRWAFLQGMIYTGHASE